LRDGYHESFGAPHDGVGFVPGIMNHNHGSTAICGVVLGSSTAFGEPYADSAFGGNVTTCRINRNTLVRNGSSLRAREEPDFLVSGDPWFRPVYLQAGPDGALYVADFYNKIIGHYEVPLEHPGRDRHRGRIWKISYRGSDSRRDIPVAAEGRSSAGGLAKLSIEKVVRELGSSVLARRALALDELEQRPLAETARALREGLPQAAGLSRAYISYALERLGELGEADIAAAVSHPEAVVRVHAQRLLAETSLAGEKSAAWVLSGFKDQDPMVRRAAVQASASRPAEPLLRPLLGLHQSTPAADVHLRHSIRIALRNHLRNDEWFRELTEGELSADESRLLAGLCLALKNRGAGEFIVSQLDRLGALPAEKIGEYLRFSARYVPRKSVKGLVAFTREKFRGDREFQGELIEFIRQGLQERGVAIPASVRSWAVELAKAYLETGRAGLTRGISWEYVPHPSAPRQENPWQFSTRRSFARQAAAPSPTGAPVLSSFPTGEQKVGTYRSGSFVLPEKFGFWIAGHDKRPDEPLGGKNFVRLRDALSHAVIRQVPPPRNDQLHHTGWDTSGEAGSRVYLELVDGNTDGAFAWMAVGGFSLAGLNPSRVAGDVGKGAALARSWGLSELKPLLVSLVKNKAPSYKLRGAVALQLAGLDADSRLSALALVPGLSFASDISKEQALGLIATGAAGKAGKVLESVMKVASAGGQRRLAEELAADRGGVGVLLSMVEAGKAGAALLRAPAIAQKLSAVSAEAQKKMISKLLEGLDPDNEQLNAILEKRKQGYIETPGRLDPGRELFKKTCAPCHRVGKEGRDFAPNLDGVGNRGLDRLIEDILDPNRNVDVAFRSTTVVTRKGKVATGLLRPGTGQRLVLVDREGREISIPLADVARKQPSRLSPMPANFSE
ncbi:MAG: c-type cytochrome, partial [Planctomycetota bacterium]|nr:c-type cytochrome [Planctomycetota bacterium]